MEAIDVKPEIPEVDIVVLLGSQIKYVVDRATVGPTHTYLKALAAEKYHKKNSFPIIISGGYNFGVRYSREEIIEPPNFSFEALSLARQCPSEAETIKKYLVNNHSFSAKQILIEECSATTVEQSKICTIILARTTFEKTKTVGILTLAKHMKTALPLFQKDLSEIGKKAVPIYAEDVLIENGIGHNVWYYYSDLLKRKPGAVSFTMEQLEETIDRKESISTII